MTTTEPSRIRGPADGFDWTWASETSDWVSPAVEPTPVSAPWIYDYLLGGKDNFEPDRAAMALRLAEVFYEEQSTSPLHTRTTAQVEQLFEGFRSPMPLAPVSRWGLGPDDPRPTDDVPTAGLAGVGLKD